jgi:hypothetical protein
MITPLFSLPIYTYSIDEKLYDRKNIIKTIENNYKKDKNRNHWEENTDAVQSNLHHSSNDLENAHFEKPNYKKILPVYKDIISKFINDVSVKSKTVNYDFNIANYTCMTGSQYMKSHYHPECDFTAVHYIKFNPYIHKPTLYENTHSFSSFTSALRPNLKNILDDKSCLNSWYNNNYFIDVKEHDICISPSFLFHSVPHQPQTSETRITIVLNIELN